MKIIYSFRLFSTVSELPLEWDSLSTKNVFLSTKYLKVLEASTPANMCCNFIGIYHEQELVGIALSQFLDLSQLDSYGNRDEYLKNSVRNIVIKNLSSQILVIGNNMLTGQNAFALSDKTEKVQALRTLKIASKELKANFKSKGKKIHITIFKDFTIDDIQDLRKAGFKRYFQYSTQPNMVFDIPGQWNSLQDYITALSNKYRDQYKRARKKSDGIEERKMSLEDIIKYEEDIYGLYYHVANNAYFNTFLLSKNHFRIFKAIFKEQFIFSGCFIHDKLVGFSSVINNGDMLVAYFLGYDPGIQREKMLYLNMLYNILGHGIENGFKTIVFSRTALEIKSSIGAKPQEIFGFAQHSNHIADLAFEKAFNYLEPKVVWRQRNPFR